MTDRILAITFFAIALMLSGVVVIMLLFGFVEWMQTGRWHSTSLLQAAYDAHLIRARWLLSVDWGWRVQEVLDRIPLLAVLIAMAPVSWGVGVWIARR